MRKTKRYLYWVSWKNKQFCINATSVGNAVALAFRYLFEAQIPPADDMGGWIGVSVSLA